MGNKNKNNLINEILNKFALLSEEKQIILVKEIKLQIVDK
jgi:hypothetical protein|tara:strand:- start:830 stop:949 length:120 start_codon:yes stop_codon:yes gene_type:complete